MENQVMKPYRVLITETFKKEVVVYAHDAYTAMQHAESLCAKEDLLISFEQDNLFDRKTECCGTARNEDLVQHKVFHAEERAMAQPIFDFPDCPFFLAGNAVYYGDVKFALGEDGQLYCRMPNEPTSRPVRDNVADIKAGDAFFSNYPDMFTRSFICTASENVCKAPMDGDVPGKFCYIGPGHEWIVFDDSGAPFTEEDICTDIVHLFRKLLNQARESKPSLAEQISTAEQRTQSDNNNQMAPEKDLEH